MAKLTVVKYDQKPWKKTFDYVAIDIFPFPKYKKYVPMEVNKNLDFSFNLIVNELRITHGIISKHWVGIGPIWIYGTKYPDIAKKTFPNLSEKENILLQKVPISPSISHPMDIPRILKYEKNITELYAEVVKDNLKSIPGDVLLVLYTPIKGYI